MWAHPFLEEFPHEVGGILVGRSSTQQAEEGAVVVPRLEHCLGNGGEINTFAGSCVGKILEGRLHCGGEQVALRSEVADDLGWIAAAC